ncbi:hypothetical protein [Ornithinimicrobium pratense]|uniref:Asparagine synthetase domain-containing protein n=1 Tax=Ornithinimicrobium pratense TaxID=2593973 RepID=A0A5J6V9Z0_9MICO|nr:hypothetical protein [Ornithinimicrobium pratense]QFG70023.1 hypothetical protein FY030_16075 [Ornithinimicrobium pratense]
MTTAPVDEAAVLDGAHPHGYLLVSGGTTPAGDTQGWRAEPGLLPGVVLHLHPRTVLAHGRGGHGVVVLLGHPVDVVAGITDGDRIASRLAGTWDLGGQDALVREAATLGGRWTLLAAPRAGAAPAAGTGDELRGGVEQDGRGELLVVPDTHATQPVFYAVSDGRFALASTPALVARTLGLAVDEAALALLEELRRRRGGAVTYLPGLRTAYLGLAPLVPNCLLQVRLGTRPDQAPTVRHERFWPWREREETTDVRAVYRVFRERLGAHAQLLAGLGRPALSLTAGWDSRVTATVAADVLRARDGLAFTYVNPRDARAGRAAMADVTGASAVAAQLGLAHRVLRWRQPPPGGTFDVLHRRTYAPLSPSRGAAHAMWADLPRDGSIVQLQSNGGETGTTFIQARTGEPLSPVRLARMMMGATEGLEDLAGQMYDGYQDHAAMTADRLLGYDHHDLFYWEQRIGRWGWQKFTDGDFGHRILLPFNDRVLLETMLSLPYPQREAKVLFERILADEPAGRLPERRSAGRAPEATATTRLGALTRRVSTRLPGVAGRLGQRVGGRLERVDRDRAQLTGLDRLTWPRGYAVLPAAAPAARPGWARRELPGGTMTLEAHPALPHAQVPFEGGGVVVLGDPVDVEAGLTGAREVAGALAQQLRTHPGTPAAALAAVEARAATLAGGWLVLLSTPARTVVIPDPLVSLGLHLLEGGVGLVSHDGLAPGPSTCLGADHLLAAAGPLGVVPLHPVSLAVLVDLPGAARHAADQGWTRGSRLARHTELLRRRGPVWLGLTGEEGSRQLLELLAQDTADVQAISWWDRLAPDEAADPVFTASTLAATAGVPHRVLGLREDLDGAHGGPGRSARGVAEAALAASWPQDGRVQLPLSDALDQALPDDAVLWLGSRPVPPRALGAPAGPSAVCCNPRVIDLTQGVRPVALPFSDRLLSLLPR